LSVIFWKIVEVPFWNALENCKKVFARKSFPVKALTTWQRLAIAKLHFINVRMALYFEGTCVVLLF
jgi:hypothetical protein